MFYLVRLLLYKSVHGQHLLRPKPLKVFIFSAQVFLTATYMVLGYTKHTFYGVWNLAAVSHAGHLIPIIAGVKLIHVKSLMH